MLTKFRAGVLALAATLCAPAAAMAACPTAPTYTGLSGLDAASATKTMQSVVSAGSSQQLATPLIHGNDGTTTPKAVAVDASCNLDVNVQAGAVGINAQTTGGASNYTFEVAASDNHQVVKNGAGTWYGFDAWSKHSAALYIRFYDLGTGFNGCNSATGLIWEGQVPANSTPANGAGAVRPFDVGRAFTTGLAVCVTGAYGNTDTTSATASVASVNVGYK